MMSRFGYLLMNHRISFNPNSRIKTPEITLGLIMPGQYLDTLAQKREEENGGVTARVRFDKQLKRTGTTWVS